jgi:hypothetical protein
MFKMTFSFAAPVIGPYGKKTSRQVVVMPVLYGGVSDIENFELMGDEIVVVDSAHCITPRLKAILSFFLFTPISLFVHPMAE